MYQLVVQDVQITSQIQECGKKKIAGDKLFEIHCAIDNGTKLQ